MKSVDEDEDDDDYSDDADQNKTLEKEAAAQQLSKD